MEHKKFWLVWHERGSYPIFKHENYEDACNEAERLAKLNQGIKIYVLECVSSCVKDDVVWSGKIPVQF